MNLFAFNSVMASFLGNIFLHYEVVMLLNVGVGGSQGKYTV